MNRLDEFIVAKERYEQMIQDDGKIVLRAEFKELFDKHPKLVGVRWTQYTPHFNDGDACVFGVGEFYFRFAGDMSVVNNDKGEDEDEDSYRTLPYRDQTAEQRDLSAFAVRVSIDDILRAIFGDGVRVTATRRGFKVEEYEHD